jgi:hydroxymethylpyrimidine pyrophosphatase-like HAD family hydrolase
MSTRSTGHPRYDLLAIDLDGTLVNNHHTISARNIAAISAARAAGIEVVICTGRGLKECSTYLKLIDQTGPVAVAGGSIIADPTTGRTLHRFAMEETLVHDVVEALHGHNHAAMVLKDPLEAGFDYLVVQSKHKHTLDPVMHWWFDLMKVGVRYIDHLHSDEHPQHTVRIGAFGVSTQIGMIAAQLTDVVKDRAVFHHFSAVVGPDHAQRLQEGEKFHILELFSSEGNKWSAVQHLAQQRNIPASRIAAIGDEVNDVPMIRGAGLGIAMGNAIPAVAQLAKVSTKTNDQDGVAHAIDKMLTGEW